MNIDSQQIMYNQNRNMTNYNDELESNTNLMKYGQYQQQQQQQQSPQQQQTPSPLPQQIPPQQQLHQPQLMMQNQQRISMNNNQIQGQHGYSNQQGLIQQQHPQKQPQSQVRSDESVTLTASSANHHHLSPHHVQHPHFTGYDINCKKSIPPPLLYRLPISKVSISTSSSYALSSLPLSFRLSSQSHIMQ